MDTLDQFVGSAGEARRREYEKRNTEANVVDARAVRQDLLVRLPYGRALDDAHLLWLLDESNQRNWAIVMRRRLLAHALHNLPAGIMVDGGELALLRADSIANPTRAGACPGIPEWPASS